MSGRTLTGRRWREGAGAVTGGTRENDRRRMFRRAGRPESGPSPKWGILLDTVIPNESRDRESD